MRRDGSTLSEKLRSAWDGSVLANRTKGKHLIAANAHVCVLGHTTESDLRDQMKAAEVFNGFANRFLWIATRRVQLLPFGGGHVDLSGLVERFREAIDLGRREQEMEFDTEVKEIWDQGGLYRLLTERPDNLFGVVTSRADAHVTRLALLYSILDQAAAIRKSHLLAALAFWDFSERTARWLFGQSLGDEYADTIEEAGRERYPGVLTRTEIRDLFGRHAAPGRIPRALGLLEKQGRMERRDLPTGGRPTEAWMLCDRDQCDKSDESPLQRARRLAT